jgi:hypothetical protein
MVLIPNSCFDLSKNFSLPGKMHPHVQAQWTDQSIIDQSACFSRSKGFPRQISGEFVAVFGQDTIPCWTVMKDPEHRQFTPIPCQTSSEPSTVPSDGVVLDSFDT